MFFDSHAHLNFAAFPDADEVIKRTLTNDTWMVNVGSQLFTSRRAVELAQQHKEGVYASVGLHPVHISDQEIGGDEEQVKEKYTINDLPKVISEIRNLAQQDKVVAIGEVGLDYFHLSKTSPSPSLEDGKLVAWQKEYLVKFVELAIELDKPLILHCRSEVANPNKAWQNLAEVIKSCQQKTNTKKLRGVVHCFGASREIAQQFIDLGFCVGFTGIVTFKNAKELQEVAKNIELAKILIETDCPYLTPEPFRGKRNEPIYVKYVAQKIAELKGLTVEEVERVTNENARNLFGV